MTAVWFIDFLQLLLSIEFLQSIHFAVQCVLNCSFVILYRVSAINIFLFLYLLLYFAINVFYNCIFYSVYAIDKKTLLAKCINCKNSIEK